MDNHFLDYTQHWPLLSIDICSKIQFSFFDYSHSVTKLYLKLKKTLQIVSSIINFDKFFTK